MSTGEVSQIPSAPQRIRAGLLRRVLPSGNVSASDHAGREIPVNAGSARESFAPIGSNLPDFDNYSSRCYASSWPVSLLGLEPAMSLQRIFRLRRGGRPSHPISLALAAELDIVRHHS